MKRPMLRLLLSALAAMLVAAGQASAQSCSFSVTNVSFGTVDTLSGGAVDAVATVDITCGGAALGATVRICLNLNQGSGGAVSGVRQMQGPGTTPLAYNFYQDPARSVPWGSVTQPSLGNPVAVNMTLPALGGSTSTSRTIYARVFANQQTVSPGAYTSTFAAAGSGASFTYTAYLLIPPSCQSVNQNQTSPSFSVLANAVPNCMVTAQNINFGSHGVLSGNIDAAGGLGVTCTEGTAYTVGLNNGLTGTDPTDRRMTLGGEAVTYGLYKDAARTQPWGNAGGDLVTGTGAGATLNLPVYGRVPPQATPPAGTYTDTVVVTVTY